MADQGERILVVDDDSIAREIVCECLDQMGYSVDHVASGEEGLRKIEVESQDYALVLVDYYMTGMNGGEFIKQAKSESPDTMFILVTSANDVKIAVDALKSGAYDYIGKPFDVYELTYSVRRILRHRSLEMAQKQKEKRLVQTVQKQSSQLLDLREEFRENLRQFVGSCCRNLYRTRPKLEKVVESGKSMAVKIVEGEGREEDTRSMVETLEWFLVGREVFRRSQGEVQDGGKWREEDLAVLVEFPLLHSLGEVELEKVELSSLSRVAQTAYLVVYFLELTELLPSPLSSEEALERCGRLDIDPELIKRFKVVGTEV